MIALLRFAFVALVVMSLAASQQVLASDVRYRIVDLGTLGSGSSFAEDLNDLGNAVGWSGLLNRATTPRPFLYQGAIRDLGSGADQLGRAIAINNRGQVVGDAETITPEGFDAFRAFVFQNGAMTNLGTLGGVSSQAHGINNNGNIVGRSEFVPPRVIPSFPFYSWHVDRRYHAFYYSGGAMHDLHELAGLLGENSMAFDINDVEQVVGYYETGVRHGFLYQNGQTLDLGTLGGVSGIPLAINNNGHVVGYRTVESGDDEAFLYHAGVVTFLGSLGGAESIARDINDVGTTVGQATLEGSSSIGNPIWHAFVYEGGSMLDLNTLIPGGSDWVLKDAAGINASGQIVGTGRLNDANRAYLLTPIPEPSTATIVSVFIVILLCRYLGTGPLRARVRAGRTFTGF